MAKFLFFESAVMELIVENGATSGGAAVQTLVWMEGLHALGNEVLLTCDGQAEYKIKKEYEFIQLVPFQNSNKGIKVIRWITHILPETYRLLNKHQPDFLYEAVPFWGTYLYASICKSLSIKHITRISSDALLDQRIRLSNSLFHQFFLNLGLRFSNIILAQNDYQYKTLKNKFPQKEIYQIYNPIKIDEKFLQQKKNIEGYFAWIANFRYAKNLKLLYHIAKSLPEEIIKIAGVPTNHFDEESKAYVKKLKELPNVIFMGKIGREEIFPFLQNAKFLLNTSRYEGFSNTFLEAMATGTPILTSSLVNPDGIIDKNGLGYVYGDEDDLQFFLKNISNEKYMKLSENCLNYVKGNHEYITLSRKLMGYIGLIK